MTYQESIKSLRHGTERHFVLVGDEPFLKEQFIRACKYFNNTFTVFKFDMESEDEALSSLGGNFFGNRIIILRSIDKMDVDKFAGAVKQSQDFIIMLPSDTADMRSRAITRMTGVAAPVVCNKLREYNDDYPEWIMAKAVDAGYDLSIDQSKYIYSMVGPDLYALVNELKKLFLYKGSDKNIIDADLRSVTSYITSGTSYDFLDSFLSKNIDKTLQGLDSYCRSQETFSELIYFLCSYTEKLLKIASLLEQKKTPDEIAERVDIPKFLIKTKYIRRAQELGSVWFVKLMGSLGDMEARVRTFKGDTRILFENFIFTMLA